MALRPRQRHWRRALLSLFFVLAATTAKAATFGVTNLNDSGPGSLRQAVLDANASPGPDVIVFFMTGMIVLTTGEIPVTESVEINGPGAADLTIGANDASRIFNIASAAFALQTVLVANLTLTDGDGANGGAIFSTEDVTIAHSIITGNAANRGGAIAAEGGSLTLQDTTISDNAATFNGGGVYANGATNLWFEATRFTGNTASVGGAADISNAERVRILQSLFGTNTATTTSGAAHISAIPGKVVIEDTTFQNNSAPRAGAVTLQNVNEETSIFDTIFEENKATTERGALDAFRANVRLLRVRFEFNDGGATGIGGAYIEDSSPTVIEDTTISHNTADAAAGLYLVGAPGSVIRRTTISQNTAAGMTGGLGVIGTVHIENCTISGNIAGSGAGMVTTDASSVTIDSSTITGNAATSGGGNLQVDGSLVLENTIVANGASSGEPDILVQSGGSVTANESLIETPGAGPIAGANNIVGVDPQLGPLQDNGGPTQTHMISAASPAKDAGDAALTAATTDQRGFARVAGPQIDMGAVELQGTADLAVSKALTSPGPFVVGNTVTFTIVVTNNGPDIASNVTVTDVLPAGTTFVSATPSSGTCSGTTTVTCNVGTLPDGGSASITLAVQVTTAGTITNTASAGSDATDPTAASANAPFTVSAPATPTADLSLAKTIAGSTPVAVGGLVTFNVTVRNDGPDTATNVIVTDTLPSGLSFVSATPSAGTCSGSTTVTCNVGSLANAATATVAFVVRVTAAGTIINTATAGSDQADATPATANAALTAAAPAGIPMLSPWMLTALASLLAAAGALRLRP